MRFSILVGAAFVGIALLVSQGISQEKKSKGQLPPGWKELELTPEQLTKIRGVQSEYKTRIKGLEEQMKALKTQEKSEMVKLLTDSQKEKLKNIALGESGKPAPASKQKKDQPK